MDKRKLNHMSKPIKTRGEIANQLFVTKTDIQKLFGCRWKKASELFDVVNDIDKELPFRIHDDKVRLEIVLQKAGISQKTLAKLVQSNKKGI